MFKNEDEIFRFEFLFLEDYSIFEEKNATEKTNIIFDLGNDEKEIFIEI